MSPRAYSQQRSTSRARNSGSGRESFDNLAGTGDKTKTELDVPERGLAAEIGRGRSTAIFHQHAIVAEEMRVGQRVQHALIGVDAAEEQRLDIEVLEDAVQRRVPEAADAIFIDLDIFRKLLQFVDDGRRPAVLLEQMRAIARQLAPDADAVAVAVENIQRGRRQVLAIGAVAPVQPDDRNPGRAKRRQQPLQRLDRRAFRTEVGTKPIDPTSRSAEI